jgi:spore maturation protein CgeB
MKVLSIITKFPDYLHDFFARHPNFIHKSYASQHEDLVNDTYGSFETWTEGLSKLGYETERIFATIYIHQKQWAAEHGVGYNDSDWMQSIVKAQVKHHSPDIIVVSKQSTFSRGFVASLRREISSTKLVISWCGAPYRDISLFREYDFILSNVPELIHGFHQQGLSCYFLKHSFDPRILKSISRFPQPKIDFLFTGSITKAEDFHNQREQLLLRLIEESNLQIWSPVKCATAKQKLVIRGAAIYHSIIKKLLQLGIRKETILKILRKKNLPNLENNSYLTHFVDERICKRAHPPAFGIPMYSLLANSKITLNTHIDISSSSASNMRLFEATGVGTCLLTDWKNDLSKTFEPEIEVATYKNIDECIDKAKFLIANENARNAIAQAGQERTLGENTIYHRAEELDIIIRNKLRIPPGL